MLSCGRPCFRGGRMQRAAVWFGLLNAILMLMVASIKISQQTLALSKPGWWAVHDRWEGMNECIERLTLRGASISRPYLRNGRKMKTVKVATWMQKIRVALMLISGTLCEFLQAPCLHTPMCVLTGGGSRHRKPRETDGKHA